MEAMQHTWLHGWPTWKNFLSVSHTHIMHACQPFNAQPLHAQVFPAAPHNGASSRGGTPTGGAVFFTNYSFIYSLACESFQMTLAGLLIYRIKASVCGWERERVCVLFQDAFFSPVGHKPSPAFWYNIPPSIFDMFSQWVFSFLEQNELLDIVSSITLSSDANGPKGCLFGSRAKDKFDKCTGNSVGSCLHATACCIQYRGLQGSILEPLLLCLHMLPLGKIIMNFISMLMTHISANDPLLACQKFITGCVTTSHVKLPRTLKRFLVGPTGHRSVDVFINFSLIAMAHLYTRATQSSVFGNSLQSLAKPIFQIWKVSQNLFAKIHPILYCQTPKSSNRLV